MVNVDTRQSELPAIIQLYGSQSASIDTGAAGAWADTFTEDGRFESPTYAAPVVGRSELTAFAESFAENSPRTRHVITNVHIEAQRSPTELLASAYLLIVKTHTTGAVEILRLTTVRDVLVRVDGHWKVRRRQVVVEAN